MKEKAADPLRFPDLSLTIIKLMGSGEYVAELPGETAPGHFGLARQGLCAFHSSQPPISRPRHATPVESRHRRKPSTVPQ